MSKRKKKSIALKATMKKVEESEDEHSSDNAIQDEDLAMIVRKFKKFMVRKKRINKKPIKKGEIRREKEKEKVKEKDQGSVYYECKKPEHLRYDCPLIKSYVRKKMKKAWPGVESANFKFILS